MMSLVRSEPEARQSPAIQGELRILDRVLKPPRPVISTRTVSPGWSVTGGWREKPTPAGVPVAIRSPGDSVRSCDR